MADIEGELGGSAQQPVVLRRKAKSTRPGNGRAALNGVVRLNRPKSEYISPSGVSTLDIRTRLRITEAELAIVQREVSDLLAERNTLEASARQFEDSWKFTVQECGRIVEQRDELQSKLEMLEQVVSSAYHQIPESHKGKKGGKVSRADLDQCRLMLETQTRVCETLEQERDRANDDYDFAQAQLHTLMSQYQDLAESCSEVARERDKARREVQMLREELHRYEPEPEANTREAKKSNESLQSQEEGSAEAPPNDTPLPQQLKEMKEERDTLQSMYEQAIHRAEQYQKQLYRAEEDRRQALATSEALTALWQKKFEKAQSENYELRQELLSAQDRISHLHEKLAVVRIQSRTPSSASTRPSPPEGDAPPLFPPHTPTSTTLTSYSSQPTPPHRAASFHSMNSLGTSLGPGARPGFPLSQPHSSLHHTNSLNPGSSTGVGKSPRWATVNTSHELISPSTGTYHAPSKRLRGFNDIHEVDNHSTDEEASWI